MQKIKNKTRINFQAILLFVLLACPVAVFAYYDSAGNVQQSGNNISIRVNGFNANGFLFATYVAPTKTTNYLGNTIITPATCKDGEGKYLLTSPRDVTGLDNPANTTALNSGASPAVGFCNGIVKCNYGADGKVATSVATIAPCNNNITGPTSCAAITAINNCEKAVASAYNQKIIDAMQAAVDAKIESNGLDKTKANDAIASCGGDLACINKVLASMQADSSFAKSTTTTSSADAPLTASSLSDLINQQSASQSSGSTTLNAASNTKGTTLTQDAPKVSVTFTTSGDPTKSSVKTATAVPSFFNGDDPSKLYFTWYLKRKGCELTDKDHPSGRKWNDDKDEWDIIANDTDASKLASCDFDGDSKITVNDWKIAAAKIVAVSGTGEKDDQACQFSKTVDASNKSCDSNNDGKIDSSDAYFQNVKGVTDGYTAVPEFKKNKSDSDNTNIGWRNGFLMNGSKPYENNDDAAANCYVKAPVSGNFYELRETKTDTDSLGASCKSGYHMACVADQTASCNVLNPAYNKSVQDQIDAHDLANPTTPDPPYTTPKSMPQNFPFCGVSSEGKSIKASCAVDDVKNFTTKLSCNNTSDGKPQFAICVKDDMTLTNAAATKLGIIFGSATISSGKVCSAVAKPNPDTTNYPGLFLPTTNTIFTSANEKCSFLTSSFIAGTKTTAGAVDIAADATLNPSCKFKEGANTCKHLFPVMPSSVRKDDGVKQAVVGDGEFDLAEKNFWGFDLTKNSADASAKEEAKIVGLGADTFNWTYSPEDQVGVVVEGDSLFSTDHSDVSSKKRMWAFSNGKCPAMDNMEKDSNVGINKRSFYLDGNMGILTTELDLNDCLPDNLLSPNAQTDDNGVSSALSVNVTASPQNPVNDPNGNGDTLEVSSIPTNTQDPRGLLYDWTVWESKDGSDVPTETTAWTNITDKAIANGSFTQGQAQGLGKSSFDMDLNLTNDIIKAATTASKYKGNVFYLKLKVKISGTATDGAQDAFGAAVVRVTNQTNSMKAYSVTADKDGKLKMTKTGSTGKTAELCADQTTECNVYANEIVGLDVPNSDGALSNFSWKVNEVSATCNNIDCAPGGSVLFIPILGNVGESVSVVATARNTKTNETVEVSRYFVIGSPNLQIGSSDNNAWPKLLGYYKGAEISGSCSDAGAGCAKDLSTQVLETNTGSVVTLQANSADGFDWTIDGQSVSEYQNQNQIQLTINKAVGDSYNISIAKTVAVGGKDDPTANLNKALYKNWLIAPEDETDEQKSATVQLNVIENTSQTVSEAKSTFFGASLITHLPEQFMFLLKISLTSLLVFFLTGLLFAFIPEKLFRDGK